MGEEYDTPLSLHIVGVPRQKNLEQVDGSILENSMLEL